MHVQFGAEILKNIIIRNRSSAAFAGPPGVGKSQIVRQLAIELGLEHRPVEMAFYQTEDLCGVPYRDGGKTLWTKPWWFPEDGAGVLVLEDFNRVADANILNCLMGLLLDRRLHSHVLPPGWRLVATLNVGHRFMTSKLDTAHISRLALIDVEADLESLVAWGSQHNANSLVLDFLKANPVYFFQFPNDDQKPWPNPRSWLEGVGNNLPDDAQHGGDPGFLQLLVSSFVGEAPSAAFVHWLFSQPPACKDILDTSLSRRARYRFEADSALVMQRLVEFVDYLPKVGFTSNRFSNLKKFLKLSPADVLIGFVERMNTKNSNTIWTQELSRWIKS